MSRIGKEPIVLPQGIEVAIDGQKVTVKSKKAESVLNVHPLVGVAVDGGAIKVSVKDDSAEANMQSGTTRALLNNMVVGLDKGYEKKLTLIGVGYRAQVKGKVLNMNLGFSHPVDHALPDGITCECPSQTEIVLKSHDKCLLGQVAAEIRAYRPPEPYKGKGVRYADEVVRMKETKKK
ncbi:MAG: 50S ribosomal protein L6 [Succinivibrionaceae bacterium]|nr:50S ribosomal protein L6 [Succinivibrionaceae bacterium]